jgi:hypothetical protein
MVFFKNISYYYYYHKIISSLLAKQSHETTLIHHMKYVERIHISNVLKITYILTKGNFVALQRCKAMTVWGCFVRPCLVSKTFWYLGP